MNEIDKLLKEADNYTSDGDIDSAIVKCEEALQIDQKNTIIYTKLAELYVKKGQNDRALVQYLTIADAYYDSKLFKGAMKYFKRAVELDPQCLSAREKLAEIYVMEDMEREAKMEFLNIAEIYFSKNDLHKAENFVTKAIELKSIEAHYILGLIDLKREMFKEAISEFEILFKFKPNHISAITNIALSYLKLNKFQEAINYYEKVIKLAPGDVSLRENLVKAYIGNGNIISAVGQYESLAEIFIKNGENEKAIGVYKEALKICTDNTIKDELANKILSLNPSNTDAKKILEEIKKEERKTPETSHKKIEVSKPTPEEIVSSTPLIDVKGSIEDLFIKAESYLKDGFFEKAIEIYRYILRREPNNITVRQKLHQAYILAAQQEEEITETTMQTERILTSQGAIEDEGIKKEKKSKISYL